MTQEHSLQNSDPQRRISVVTPVLGIPSEIWIARQAKAFTHFSPTLVGWSMHEHAELGQLPFHVIDGAFPSPQTVFARILRKLKRPEAYRLDQAEKAAILSAFNKTKPELVMAHFGWTAIVLAQALPESVPFVVHVHGRDASALMEEPAYRAALKQVLRRADGLVAVGQHQLDRLAPLGLPAHVGVIPCGAPLADFGKSEIPDQNDAGTSSDPLKFMSVGRMSDEKGMRENVAAFRTLLQTVPNAELVLVGFGPLYEPLKAEIQAKGLADKVRLTGRLSPDEIALELSKSHVYLQHSRKHQGWVEGFGVTLTEAGAAGLPLLASASGGLIDQIVEGENGFLFPEGDVDAQAALMLRLAQDADLRTRLGGNARRLAARFDSAAMVQKLEQFLIEAMLASR